jgi:predicted nuclease of predicted toxin-antitoxin system
VRLLLDEMFSSEIARQLRLRGHDVVAVLERPALVRLLDPDVFEAAQTEQRTVVTENAPDFLRLDARYRRQTRDHYGLILTTDRRFPRRKQAIGPLISALDSLLRVASNEPACESLVHWLH